MPSNKYLLILISFTILLSKLDFITSKPNPKLIQCKEEICDSLGGNCNREGTCTCYEGFTTDSDLIKCNYEQVSAIKAGLIELATGIGLGHFYAGRKLNGLFKLFCVGIFCACCTYSLIMMKRIREEAEAEDHPYVTLLVISAAVFKVVIIIWQIIDAVLFFLRIYKDGNNILLY